MNKLSFKPPIILVTNTAGEYIWPSGSPVDLLELDENRRRDIVEEGIGSVRGLMIHFRRTGR